MISKSNECATRVGFEVTSTISDTNKPPYQLVISIMKSLYFYKKQMVDSWAFEIDWLFSAFTALQLVVKFRK